MKLSQGNFFQMDTVEDQASDGEEMLHGNIGAPVGCDPPPLSFVWLQGKMICKEFDVVGQEFPSLFCGFVRGYDQDKKVHEVHYEDDSNICYAADEILEMHKMFEHWYEKVSCGGRMMSRRAAGPFIVKTHKRSMVQARAEAQRTWSECSDSCWTPGRNCWGEFN